MSSASSNFADNTHMSFNYTHQSELPKHPQRTKTSVSPIITEDTPNDTTSNSIPADQHQVIDLTNACNSMSKTYPFVLSFNNLAYSVKVSSKMAFPFFGKGTLDSDSKILLNDISGEAREGEIMAIIGSSGAGKSTLIDALAGRIAKESLKGSVTLNSEVLESKLLKVISAYVMQDDLLFPMLTVEETLMFAAEFRLPHSLSKSRKKARVEALIDQLGLRSAAKTMIGDEGHRGVSGGERRRVSIGIDIIHDPILLFLDEPTSGLDSTNAFMVVKVLQRIAQSGSIVIMSIHQPSSRILGLLDSLIYLSHGQKVYSGSPACLPKLFAEFGHPIPQNENQSEFVLDLIRELEETPSGSGIMSLVEFNKSWHTKIINQTSNITSHKQNNLSLKDAISASISRGKLVSGTATGDHNNSDLTSFSVPTFANPFWFEILVVAKRSLTNSRRIPESYGYRIGAVIITGVILASVFWQADDTPKGFKEKIGFFSFAMVVALYNTTEALPSFIQERYIFMRETAYNAYRRSSYVIACTLISIPSLILLAFSFAAITFWSVGLAGGVSGFLFFFSIMITSFWAGSSFVTFVSGIVPNVMAGFIVLVTSMAYHILFSGFFISRDRIPIYWIWLHYTSLAKYPYQAALQNEFNDPMRCYMTGIQIFDDTPLEALPMSTKNKLFEVMDNVFGTNVTSSTCVITGMNILKREGANDISKWNCLWILIAWGFFFRILFYFTLLFGSKNKRR